MRVAPKYFSDFGHGGSKITDGKLKSKFIIWYISNVSSVIALIGDNQPYDGDPFSNRNDVEDYCRKFRLGGLQLESVTDNPYTQ